MSYIRRYMIYMILMIINISLQACSYFPVTGFDSIGFGDVYSDTSDRDSLLFHRECSKSGLAWLYECQFMGLVSIYDAIVLENPNVLEIYNMHMIFYPKGSYIIYRVHDDRLRN